MVVNSAITAYLNTNAVHIYFELECYVFGDTKCWVTRASSDVDDDANLVKFTDFQIGPLHRHETVMKYFDFSPTMSVSSLP